MSEQEQNAADQKQEETVENTAAESTEKVESEALKKAEEKVKEYQDLYLRMQAEVENIRRQSSKSIEKERKFALEKFAKDLLGVVDSLELGLQEAQKSVQEQNNELFNKFIEGKELTLKQLLEVLEKYHIRVVNPVGEKFNPELHQALGQQENEEYEPNTVIMVMQKGYTLEERLLRPALVMISKAK